MTIGFSHGQRRDYLGVYSASALSIGPKTRVSKIDALKEIIRAWGSESGRNLDQRSVNSAKRNNNES